MPPGYGGMTAAAIASQRAAVSVDNTWWSTVSAFNMLLVVSELHARHLWGSASRNS